jgi:hypothetical protein
MESSSKYTTLNIHVCFFVKKLFYSLFLSPRGSSQENSSIKAILSVHICSLIKNVSDNILLSFICSSL